MKLDSHQVRLAIAPSALLALPGAAYGAVMQALVCQHLLDYNWSWLFCLMVGSVLSATDPVSVVSMLKSVSGGSTSTVKLTYLITGESLLNDGTALVIFEAIVSRHYNTDESVVMYFVRVLFISPCLGVLLGLMTVFVLRKAKRRLSPEDNVVQVAITIACAYISFFLAQWVLKVSGIICCCAAGLIIAWLAPALIIQPEQMEVIWHTMEWVGNTMIFTIAGLIVGKYASDIDGEVVGATFLIYVTMMLIRLSMLTICYPAVWWLSRKEYSYKDVIFSTFGGLRGAISLALVLIIEKHLKTDDVEEDDHDTARYFDAEAGRKAMMIICGCVFLTIVINGTFAGTFFQWLYGSRLSSDVDEIIFHYVEKRIRRKARDFISHTDILPPFDADEVKKLCHCFSYHFSTTEHTMEEKELLDSEKKGEGHVEFEDSGSGKHKVAHLVAGPEPGNESQKRHSLYEASPADAAARRQDASSSGGQGSIVSARRDSSNSSLTSLANQLLGRKGMGMGQEANSAGSVSGGKPMNVQPSSPGSVSAEATSDGNIKVDRRYSESVYRKRYTVTSYTLNNDLIVKFRQVFHGITKHCYMRQIANGRLTRGSSVALTLLHASRHGTETCDIPGLHDYDSIIDALEVYDTEKKWVAFAKTFFSEGGSVHKWLSAWEDSYVGDRVYILTSFIEAHNYAQRITIKYLGEKGFVDTEEEALILQESHICLKKAQMMLADIDSDIISFHATEMVARMVLNMANDTVMQFQEEGILSEKDSEVFLEKSYEDLRHLHSDHHRHAQLKRMRAMRQGAGAGAGGDIESGTDIDADGASLSTRGGIVNVSDIESEKLSSPPLSPSESMRFAHPLSPKKDAHKFWFFSAEPSKPSSTTGSAAGSGSDSGRAITVGGNETSLRSVFDIDTGSGSRLSLHTDTSHSNKLRNRISTVDREASHEHLDALGEERRSAASTTIRGGSMGGPSRLSDLTVDGNDELGRESDIIIPQSASQDALSDLSASNPSSPLAVNTNTASQKRKAPPNPYIVPSASAGDEDYPEEPPTESLSRRNSIKDRPDSVTEMMGKGDHDVEHDIVRDNTVNVTELLEGDHDLGDELDALSRKFQHAGIGRRPSIDEHVPAEDAEDIARAATMAKVHRGSNAYQGSTKD